MTLIPNIGHNNEDHDEKVRAMRRRRSNEEEEEKSGEGRRGEAMLEDSGDMCVSETLTDDEGKNANRQGHTQQVSTTDA